MSNAPKKEIWSSLLKSVSSGKKLAEKQLVVLGGSPESQREFVASLETDATPTPASRNQTSQKPPIANDFALGYTYQDVLDTDHEDMLARLSIYTLSKPSPHFIPLLRPLFTPQTIPNMLLVILLDWSDPWTWLRQLRSWIRLLHSLLPSLPKDTVQAFEDNIIEWRDNKRNDSKDTETTADGAASLDADVALPLGPGEWDSPLGVPLCVVCQNSNKIEVLEKEQGWRDTQFDFVQQFLRTILLKHGGSLIYAMPHLPGTTSGSTLQTLIHSSLGIQSMLQKKTPLKHNTTDRDHILVPPNFDSWGKIRILTESFYVEDVSLAWTDDISTGLTENEMDTPPEKTQSATDAVAMYEEVIKNPRRGDLVGVQQSEDETGIDVASKDVQAFLSEQSEKLESLAKEDANLHIRETTKKPSAAAGGQTGGDVQEHIGNVQFNVGGIQMDVEQALKQLNNRNAAKGDSEPPKTPPGEVEDEKARNEQLSSFFASLIKKPGGSATNSPRRGTDGRSPG
ncbi:hypothetical protein BT63DRAFT_377307 [Microthyrium microscopicum]|uniref:Dynein light intermediate chain n=1 Tax=Microthyrium microscopicum TaxID=703497 RepID=A0A6A6TZG3_9PEZI|nr:hypothetical protein BT63DRAFT_377307 [Microthyrium microscopicum]